MAIISPEQTMYISRDGAPPGRKRRGRGNIARTAFNLGTSKRVIELINGIFFNPQLPGHILGGKQVLIHGYSIGNEAPKLNLFWEAAALKSP
jgi:hypothetical protein